MDLFTAPALQNVPLGIALAFVCAAIWFLAHRQKEADKKIESQGDAHRDLSEDVDRLREQYARDWETQRVANERGKAADEQLLREMAGLSAQLIVFAGELRDLRKEVRQVGEGLARLEGASGR